MLGGSTVFFGEPPISKLLEELFRFSGQSRVKVYNYGVVSSTSGMDLARIVYEVSEQEPDLVVFYNGANDFNHPLDWDPRPGYPFNFITYENNPVLESHVRDYPALALFLYSSNIMRYLLPFFFAERFVPLEEMRNSTGWMTDEWKEGIAAAYVGNLIKADKVSRAFGARFIAFFQPGLYFKNSLTSFEQSLAREDERLFSLEMRERILARYKLSRSNGDLQFCDLSRIYENVPEWVFIDRIHTRQSAKVMVAQEMYSQMVSRGLLER